MVFFAKNIYSLYSLIKKNSHIPFINSTNHSTYVYFNFTKMLHTYILYIKYLRALAGNGLGWGRTERIRVPGVNHAWWYTRFGLLPTWRSRKLCFWTTLSYLIAEKNKLSLSFLDAPGIWWKFVHKYIYLSIFPKLHFKIKRSKLNIHWYHGNEKET